MNDKEQLEFLQALDANTMYAVQGVEKLLEDMAHVKKLANVTARNGTPWDINGYVYGRTSNGDPYVLLYPSHPKMVHKVTRVYPHQFYDLPYFITTNVIPEDAQDGNPTKTQAKKQGIYQQCPEFEIATVNGKDTNMGPEQRFLMTISIPQAQAAEERIITEPNPAPPAPTAPIKTKPPETQEQEVITPAATVPADAADNGVADVTELNKLLGLGPNDPEPQKPYTYKDGTELTESAKLYAIYMAFWKTTGRIVDNGQTLESWYKRNQEHPAIVAYLQ